MEITLSDLRPQSSEFTLQNGKTYRLRKLTLADLALFQDTFKEDFAKLFTESMSNEQLCRVAYHQLVDDDKVEFAAQNVKIQNDEGEETIVRMGGWKLFRTQVSGMPDMIEIYKGVMATVGMSSPMLNKILSAEEKQALNIKEPTVKKKKLTGRK